jgi:hypothetical protein
MSSNTAYFFLENTPDNDSDNPSQLLNGLKILNMPVKTINCSDRIYNVKETYNVRELPFVMYLTYAIKMLPIRRTYNMIEIDDDMRIYYDHKIGFIECDANRYNDALEVMYKLIKPSNPLIFFLNN